MGKKESSVFERLEAEVVSEASDFVKEKVTKKIIKVGEVSVSFLLAFVLIIVGVAELIGSFVPVLAGGFNYLLMGVLFLVIGGILK